MCDRQFDAWGLLQFSNDLDTWRALSKGDKLGVCKNVYCSCTVLVRFVFFYESCSDVQMTWNLERTSCIKLSIAQNLFWIFLIFLICYELFSNRVQMGMGTKTPYTFLTDCSMFSCLSIVLAFVFLDINIISVYQ